MNIVPVITIEGTYGGDYYCPADQIAYIDSDTFMNVSDEDIILYDTDSIDYILLKPFQEPMHYDGANLVVVSDFGSLQFNSISYFYRTKEFSTFLYLYLILGVCILKLFKH